MTSRALRALLAAACTIAFMATAAHAQDCDTTPPHVRGTSAETTLLLHDLVGRSATARSLVDRLEVSDLVVYIRYRWFTTGTLRGRIGLLASDANRRFLLIELSARYTHVEQLVALGHELQHATEIADSPLVRDVGALAALYTRIGESTGTSGGFETYETRAAENAGHLVRRELASPVMSADAADADRN
jgi:hypothetical protein